MVAIISSTGTTTVLERENWPPVRGKTGICTKQDLQILLAINHVCYTLFMADSQLNNSENDLWHICPILISNRSLLQTITLALYANLLENSELLSFENCYSKLKSTSTLPVLIAKTFTFFDISLATQISSSLATIMYNHQSVSQGPRLPPFLHSIFSKPTFSLWHKTSRSLTADSIGFLFHALQSPRVLPSCYSPPFHYSFYSVNFYSLHPLQFFNNLADSNSRLFGSHLGLSVSSPSPYHSLSCKI